MCGMQRTTVSPSSSSTRRSTPCVAGCCGPMLISMCSPASSGAAPRAGGSSVVTEPFSVTVIGVRTARPSESTPAVPSATSTVLVLVAILLARPFAAGEAATHVVREILERLRDGELLHGVAAFRRDAQRLTELLGAAEAATQRKILAQRIALAIRLPHQNATQIGVPSERDAEHVEALALEPIRGFVDRPHAVDCERRALVERDLHAQEATERERAQMPHDLEGLLGIAELDGGDVGEIVVLLRRIIVQPANDLAHGARLDIDIRVAPDHLGAHERLPEVGSDRRRRGIGLAAALRKIARRRGRRCAR